MERHHFHFKSYSMELKIDLLIVPIDAFQSFKMDLINGTREAELDSSPFMPCSFVVLV